MLAQATLVPHQSEIADSILSSRKRLITLAGLAGTGKTTVARHIYEMWRQQGHHVVALAPTGKASMVLRSKGVPAMTIHRGIYNFGGKYKDERGEWQLRFTDNNNGRFCDRLIVDEGSMLTAKQLDDITSRNIQTLICGDPGQLKPVKAASSGVLDKPDYKLEELHRQAEGSPIIQYAYMMRRGRGLFAKHPGISHINVSGKGPAYVAAAMNESGVDRLITKTNAQRVAINFAVRAMLGRGGLVTEGDEIICVLNNKEYDTINGEIYVVDKVLNVGREYSVVDVTSLDTDESKRLTLWNAQFGQEKKLDDENIDDDVVLFDYAYGITCHKAQGSSWRHVGVTAKGYCGNDVAAWDYTAVTRAEENVTVFY